jgi:hypothetical protein
MPSKRKRQIKRTESEWAEIFKKFAKSGLTIKEFCRRNKLVLSTFKRWQQKLEETPAQFVDLSTVAESASAPSWEFAVTLPNGVHLQFRG